MTAILKDPDERESVTYDFTGRLVTGETIASVEMVAPTGITVAPSGYPTTFDARTVTAWLAGGTVGSKLNVVARITTSAGRVKEQAIRVRIFDRSGTSTTVPGGSGGGAGTFDITGSSLVDNGDGTYTLTAA